MLDRKPLELNLDFRYALERMEAGASLFVTGRAGTGKSTLLQLFKRTTRRRTVVLAPTGVAALNVGGQTIHSFFGFPPRLLDARDITRRRNRYLYERLETLVIDEISMVRADLLDHIDIFLRVNRDDARPFGGVQLLLFGDLFQLPPVVASMPERQLFSTTYTSPYFFAARIMQEVEPEMIELQKVYRQENRQFLSLLEAIRTNRVGYDELAELNARCQPDFAAEDFYLTLSARNATVDRLNRQELDAIGAPAQTYIARVQGKFPDSLFPTDAALRLKEGAQVMFLRNDPEGDFVNGTIGQVVELRSETVCVRIAEGGKGPREIEVGPYEWEVLRYQVDPDASSQLQTEVIGSFRQLPLRLAWAVTIHKAQGKTFDRVIIDLGRGGAFEHGQTYVALSRCRSLEGIVLRQPLQMRDVMVDERVADYYLRKRQGY